MLSTGLHFASEFDRPPSAEAYGDRQYSGRRGVPAAGAGGCTLAGP